MRISRRRLSNCVKIYTKKRAARTARLFFLIQRQRRRVDGKTLEVSLKLAVV